LPGTLADGSTFHEGIVCTSNILNLKIEDRVPPHLAGTLRSVSIRRTPPAERKARFGPGQRGTATPEHRETKRQVYVADGDGDRPIPK
jgi:hypothetical protein